MDEVGAGSQINVYNKTNSAFTNRFFFFNDTATTEIYTLSLHDALPISTPPAAACTRACSPMRSAHWEKSASCAVVNTSGNPPRSEEHTSELQSQSNLVCRLLLEKKKIEPDVAK